MIVVGKENGQDCADTQEVLDLEGVEIGIMCRLEIVEHEVDDVTRGTDEEKLEGREIQRICESPEEI